MPSGKSGTKKVSSLTSTKSKTARAKLSDHASEVLESSMGERTKPMLGLETLEKASESLTEGSKKILETILTDIFPEKDGEQDSAVVAGIKQACKRAQMTSSGDEVTFWRHVSDPGFMKVVKETGAALVGMHVLPLVATLLNMAIRDKDKWALKTSLQIAGLLPTKYDIYQLRYEERHQNIFSGEVNIGGKSDKELEDIVACFYDESEAEEASG
jgi:hypothetical protein